MYDSEVHFLSESSRGEGGGLWEDRRFNPRLGPEV